MADETSLQEYAHTEQNIGLEDFNPINNLNVDPRVVDMDNLDDILIKNHVSGGLPMISDSMFSLVILIYVSVAFCFVFFMFCWSSGSRGGRGGRIKHQCILMASEIAKRGGLGSRPDETAVLPVMSKSGDDSGAAAVTPLLTTHDDKDNDPTFELGNKRVSPVISIEHVHVKMEVCEAAVNEVAVASKNPGNDETTRTVLRNSFGIEEGETSSLERRT